MEEGTLPFLVEVATKGSDGVGKESIPMSVLKSNLQSATQRLGEIFAEIRSVGLFELKEVEIGLEVGAEGGVSFIGTSKISGSGSIKLTFSPPSNNSPG